MNLIDFPLVATQIVGFLLMVWILQRFAWGPVIRGLEARREKIAGEFREAERVKAEAAELRNQYDARLKTADAEARQRIQAGVAEGQKVAAEIREQAQSEAQRRLSRAEDEIVRETEKAKELLKDQVIRLSTRIAEKILKKQLDGPTQKGLADEFIDEVGALS